MIRYVQVEVPRRRGIRPPIFGGHVNKGGKGRTQIVVLRSDAATAAILHVAGWGVPGTMLVAGTSASCRRTSAGFSLNAQ